MMEHDAGEGEIDRRLAGLPAPALDDLTAERVRKRAQAELAHERGLAARPVARVWSRFVTPTLLAGAVASYLFWALQVSAALYR
jgi:hypothetical protein